LAKPIRAADLRNELEPDQPRVEGVWSTRIKANYGEIIRPSLRAQSGQGAGWQRPPAAAAACGRTVGLAGGAAGGRRDFAVGVPFPTPTQLAHNQNLVEYHVP
jgi:hypothetical protein